MRAHYLQHVPFEGLGSIERWLQRAGYHVTGTQFYASAELPPAAEVDLLVALGGPMSVNDEGQHPWLAAEKRFIRELIALERPVLGVCLGAQLIASALGAAVYPNPVKEIGWLPIQGLAPGATAPDRAAYESGEPGAGEAGAAAGGASDLLKRAGQADSGRADKGGGKGSAEPGAGAAGAGVGGGGQGTDPQDAARAAGAADGLGGDHPAVSAEPIATFRFPPFMEVFHWHGETFDLPEGAVRLARSNGALNQAFQLGRSVIGLQFHLDTTAASARELIDNCRAELVPSMYVQAEGRILAASPDKYRALNGWMDKVLTFITGIDPDENQQSGR